MNAQEWAALAPILALSAAGIIVLLASAFIRTHAAAAWLALLGLGAAFVSLWMSPARTTPVTVTPLLIVDRFALYFMGLILVSAIATCALAYGYLKHFSDRREEIYVLIVLSTLGASVMVEARHFASLFLGLELLTVSLYGMVAYVREDEHALEAGMKYLVLAAASSAFLLFGIALIYAELGTMDFARCAAALAAPSRASSPLVLYAGAGLLLTGVGFKLGVVPFHMWTPDVYEGSPAPVTAFLATASKGAMAAALLRLMSGVRIAEYPALAGAFGFVAIASMFAGNFLALKQTNVKRLLAYSSITHLGYLLVAFVASGALAAEAVMYYLAAYMITSLAAFGIVSVCSTSSLQLNTIDEYRGLYWTRPWLAAMFTAALLSLAGIPLTAGFIGKYLVISAGAGAAQWTLLAILVVNSAIGIYYYLRIVVAMYAAPSEPALHLEPLSIEGGIVLSLLTLALVVLGVYPSPLIELIRAAASGFFS
ncbi:MAG: NADH-quinone oxidoreductase subunit N [Acidobacteriota bacterium]